MRVIFAISVALALTACSHWPEPGAGGVAEFAAPAGPPRVADPAVSHHLDCSLGNLSALADAANRAGRATGQLRELDTIAARAHREVAGSLPKEAERTLLFLDSQVAALAPVLLGSAAATKQCTA